MRRHERDIEAGLGFSWRIPGGSLGRTAIGVLAASCLFAAAGSLVQVKIPAGSSEIRESAQVLVLDPSDPDAREMLDWARFHSPFPDRWEPGSDGALATMMGEITAELTARACYQPRLRPLIEEEESLPLPGMITDDPAPLPPPTTGVPAVAGAAARETRVEARSRASGPLAERWGVRVLDWQDDEAMAQLGREASFMVGVDRSGRVVYCLVMGKEAPPRIERWVRQQRVDSVPGQDEIVWDVVRVLVQAAVQTGKGEAP